jgi:hypothetical protein
MNALTAGWRKTSQTIKVKTVPQMLTIRTGCKSAARSTKERTQRSSEEPVSVLPKKAVLVQASLWLGKWWRPKIKDA